MAFTYVPKNPVHVHVVGSGDSRSCVAEDRDSGYPYIVDSPDQAKKYYTSEDAVNHALRYPTVEGRKVTVAKIVSVTLEEVSTEDEYQKELAALNRKYGKN